MDAAEIAPFHADWLAQTPRGVIGLN